MSLKKTILLVGVGTLSAAVGIAVPLVMSGAAKVAKADAVTDEAPHAEEKAGAHGKEDAHAKPAAKKDDGHAKKDDGHGKADAHGKGAGDHAGAVIKTGPQFVPFGRIVVNLNEPALTKYLSLDITLLTDAKDEDAVVSGVESRIPILRTWLTSHLADKSMEDVRGKAGINRLRREIQDQFNALLFDDGHERVRDVLFEEFHVE